MIMNDIKKYANAIDEIVKEFSAVNPKWKDIIYSEKDDGKFDELKGKLEDTYFLTVKSVVKNEVNMDEFNKEVSKKLGNRAFVELTKHVQAILTIFFSANHISECKEPALFISECFDNAILRRDPDFINDAWEQFGFKSDEDMLDAINAINSIAWNHVSMSFSKNAAKKEFKKLTDMDDAICMLYADKYDSCYDKLQAKTLMKTQHEINYNLKILIDFLSENDE